MGTLDRPRKWHRHARHVGAAVPTIMRALDTIDFHGKKVLDIGCWDGLWSFEAEKRGATTIVATDLNTQRWPPDGHLTFMLAHEALASKAIYRPDLSIYDVPRTFPERATSCSSAGYTTICAIHYFVTSPSTTRTPPGFIACRSRDRAYFDLLQEFLLPQTDEMMSLRGEQIPTHD